MRRITPLRNPDKDLCEMGDEDGCPVIASYLLDAPASYVIPLRMCTAHADEERATWAYRPDMRVTA